MRITKEKAYRANTLVAEYKDIGDFAFSLLNRKYKAHHEGDTDWGGGTPNEVAKYCREGNTKDARRAEKLVADIANVAVANTGLDLDYNLVHGVLDYGAMVAGDPMCMYGTTITETDRAPIGVYIDNWISASIPNRYIERRGSAVLALVLALSIYRPVICKYVGAAGFGPDPKTDNIQILPVPTHPMDLGRAAFMLANPSFTRMGMYCMPNTIHDHPGVDFGPMLAGGNGKHWQSTQLGNWMAERDGAESNIFLPMMFDTKDARFKSDKAALDWVQETVKSYVS